MNFLYKYANKKTIFKLGTIVTGIITAFYLWSNIVSSNGSSLLSGSITSLSSALSLIKVIVIVFYVLAVLFIFTAIIAGLYYFKKNKNTFVLVEFILFCIMSVLFLIAIPGMHAIFQLSNASSLFSIGDINYTAIQECGTYIKYIGYLSIATLIYNVVMILIDKKIINVNTNFTLTEEPTAAPRFDKVTGQPIPAEPVAPQYNATSQPVQDKPKFDPVTGEPIVQKSILDSIKEFIKTKNGKIVLAVIIVLVAAFGGYKVYDTFFNKTPINLTKNMTIKFSGKSGDGYAEVKSNKVDYDQSDPELQEFMDTTYYSYVGNKDLKNGDKVTVKVKYSKELADKLKLNITSESKTFTVKGLTEGYKNAKAIPTELFNKARDLVKKEAAKEYENDEYTTYQYSLDSTYFAKSTDDYSSDSLIFVYKVTETESWFGDNTTETYFEAYEIEDIDSSSLKKLDDDTTIYNEKLSDSNYNDIKDASQIQDGLHEYKDDAIFSKYEN